MDKNQSVDRTLDILECFTTDKPRIGLSELSRTVGLPKATVYRMAETLLARGYLEKDLTEQTYQLGYKVLKIGNVLLSNLDYRKVALPYMKQARDETNESVTLYIAINNRQRLCVERFQSTHGLSRIVNIGDIFPIDRGAPGKAILAFKDPETLLPDYAVSAEELAKIRQQGYALSCAEREVGVSAVAAPIFNQHRQVIASLSISGPSFRYEGERLAGFIKLIQEITYSISRSLGYPN